MLEEATVFRRDECLDYNFGHLGYLDDFPIFQKELIDQLVIVRINPRGNARSVIFQGGDAWHLSQKIIGADSNCCDYHNCSQDQNDNENGSES